MALSAGDYASADQFYDVLVNSYRHMGKKQLTRSCKHHGIGVNGKTCAEMKVLLKDYHTKKNKTYHKLSNAKSKLKSKGKMKQKTGKHKQCKHKKSKHEKIKHEKSKNKTDKAASMQQQLDVEANHEEEQEFKSMPPSGDRPVAERMLSPASNGSVVSHVTYRTNSSESLGCSLNSRSGSDDLCLFELDVHPFLDDEGQTCLVCNGSAAGVGCTVIRAPDSLIFERVKQIY